MCVHIMYHTYPIVFNKSGFHPTVTSKLGKSLRKVCPNFISSKKVSVVLLPFPLLNVE